MIRGHLQILKQMLTYSNRMITNSFGIKSSFVPVYHYHFSVVAQRWLSEPHTLLSLSLKPWIRCRRS